MKDGQPALTPNAHSALTRPVWVEALLVLLVGGGCALVANALSPRGLSLTRDYFPARVATPSTNRPAAPSPKPRTLTLQDPVIARLQAKGLHAADLKEVQALFSDERYQHGAIVFVDARDDFFYQIGHIPGSHPFDHYHPEKHMADVVAACTPAERIVVYCTGGDCEDSEFAAIMLTQAGIPADRLLIYTGGMDEWASKRLPIEVGLRGSGVLKPSTP